MLTDSLQLGRIVSLKKGGQVQPVVQGLAVYFDVDTLPDGTVVYNVLRPAIDKFPPDLTADAFIGALLGSIVISVVSTILGMANRGRRIVG